ncbi:MAG TPA: cupin domain-containing protein, partial [Thermoleophilaceae bacterium]|nr:cupin domain-containing protein [Thermoleophilaceae bacterium]
ILRAAPVGSAAGARALGATLHELEPRAAVSPLHVHHANGELLVVIAGRPTLRDAEGEREVGEGELVAFPAGPEGTHQVMNRGQAPARVLLISTMVRPDVVEHPESGKMLTLVGEGEQAEAHAFRLEDEVAPWTGELDEAPRPVC